MKGLFKNIIIIFLVFLLISSVFTLFNTPFAEDKTVTLSTLVNEINEGKVSKITIKSDALEIELKEGEKQKAKKETESSLSETLEIGRASCRERV